MTFTVAHSRVCFSQACPVTNYLHPHTNAQWPTKELRVGTDCAIVDCLAAAGSAGGAVVRYSSDHGLSSI